MLRLLTGRVFARSAASCRALADTHLYSTQGSTDEIGPGPGSRSRSIDQATAAGETSNNTSGPESAPARSPDAPADPADLAANRGSDPEGVLRSSAWQAQQAMSSSYERDDESLHGGVLAKGAAQAGGRLAEKVYNAAGMAAQAATGAVSAMSDAVKASTGSASSGAAHQRAQEVNMGDSPDASPVSNDTVDFGDQAAETNSDTAGRGELDTATGTSDPEMLERKAKQSKYQQAANRLMDMEGLPHK